MNGTTTRSGLVLFIIKPEPMLECIDREHGISACMARKRGRGSGEAKEGVALTRYGMLCAELHDYLIGKSMYLGKHFMMVVLCYSMSYKRRAMPAEPKNEKGPADRCRNQLM